MALATTLTASPLAVLSTCNTAPVNDRPSMIRKDPRVAVIEKLPVAVSSEPVTLLVNEPPNIETVTAVDTENRAEHAAPVAQLPKAVNVGFASSTPAPPPPSVTFDAPSVK